MLSPRALPRNGFSAWMALGLVLVSGVASAAEPGTAAFDFFEKRVRPVLVESCQKCHGPEKQEQGLRVDSLEALTRGGESGPAIVPGKPTESLLISAINHGEIYQMPPKTKLPAAQIADLTQWVSSGAVWPEARDLPAANVDPAPRKPGDAPVFTPEQKSFWAFQKPVAPPLPEVKNGAWCQSPIDRFILAGLEAKGLVPAPAADKRTLIRRATFDLHGLPPTPEEVAAFLADHSPQAFERVVDRLLASPRYGERWARHWLDVARYADSNGMDENVAYANAYRYRDYVVDAFNRDLPYDQFVREQLAGDLLGGDEARAAARITATGFLVIGPKMLAEDDPRKMEMDIVDEQLDTVGRTFLGLTIGCARCHDHKFDPFPTEDYYSLAAIFKSTKTMENFKVVAMWNERPIANQSLAAARDQWLEVIKQKKQSLAERSKQAKEAFLTAEKAKVAEYLAAAGEFQQQRAKQLQSLMKGDAVPTGAIVLEAEKYDRGNVKRDHTDYGAQIGVIYNAGELPNIAEFDITLAATGGYQIEVRFAAAEARPTKLLVDGKLIKADAAGAVTGSWQPDKQVWSAECVLSLTEGKHTIKLERAGPIPHFDKLALVPRAVAENEPAVPTAPTIEQFAAQKQLNLLFLQQWVAYLDHEMKVPSAETLPALVADEKGPFAKPKDLEQQLPEDIKKELTQLRDEVAALEKQLPIVPTAMSASEGQITNLKVHLRGNYLTLGREVPRRFPRIIAGDAQAPIEPTYSGRLQLAQWMTQPDHPLTSRVAVNRFWHWHFGNGIVRSTDNFGLLGELPDNQPLLDWLAVNFVGSHARQSVGESWSVKSLHRTLMLSSTYQMSTAHNAAAALADPENRLHWRQDRRRLEAESLRDGILAVSGQLETTMGGTLLPTANHAYVTSTASERINFYDNRRRSLYLPITRSSVYDVFQAFDFADPSAPNGQRSTTTVAPQALALMNSKLIEDRSRQWAESLLADASLDDSARVRTIYERAYSRPPSERELDRALAFVVQVAQNPMLEASAAKVQAWQSLCRVVLASSEFVYVD